MSEMGAGSAFSSAKTAYGSRLERPDADIAQERCETLACMAESTTQLSVELLLDQVVERFAADEVYIHRFRRDGVFVCHGFRAEEPPKEIASQMFDSSVGWVSEMVENPEPVLVDYRNPDQQLNLLFGALERGYVSSVSIPVVYGEELFGVLNIVYRRECPWTYDDMDFLKQIGRVIGASSRRIYASEKEAELKVLDERRLIAAEIHDDAAQLASSLSISADTVQMAYQMGNMESVEKGISKIRQISTELNKTLRDQLVSLHAHLEGTHGLIEGIREGLARLESQWGIQTTFTYDEPAEQVSMRGEVQLMRVVTECFSNIVKHSHATHVDVTLTEVPRGFLLVISDNGCGFDLENVPSDRFGLKIMRERMDMANGVIDIESTPKGTTITAAISRL